MLALGHGKDKDENRPKKLKLEQGKKVLMVAGGGQHSALIVSS